MSTTITSHVLNGVDGSHAGGLPVRLVERKSGETLSQSKTEDGGRMALTVDVTDYPLDCELVIETLDYWRQRDIAGPHLIEEIVLRFRISAPDERIHMPVIMSPYSYSTWKSN